MMPAPPETSRDGTRLPEAGAADVLYLVDLSGYVFRAYHALPPLSSSKGEPTHAVLGTVNMLQKIVAERKPRMMAVAMDSPGPTFRHGLDARYKATRPAPPPDLSAQMTRIAEIVRAWGVVCFKREMFEADDVIAAITQRALLEGWRVVIVSADKDLMQLVHDDNDKVVLWDSMRDRVYGPSEVVAKLGVIPSRVRDFLALTGDTSDNVPGVPGVGPKTAADLLAQFDSLEGIYGSLDRISKAKLQSNLREHEKDARLSQRLVTLDASGPLEWDRDKLQWGGANVVELRRLYTHLEFNRQLDQIERLVETRAETSVENRGEDGSAARTHHVLLKLEDLERVVAEARSRGELGLAVEATSSDAMRAELVGLSLAVEPGVGYYLPLGHRYLGCPAQVAWEQARPVLASVLKDVAVTKVGHDLKRASILLSRASAPLEGPAFDTLLGAYLLDPEVPNGIRELARRELGVSLTRFEDTVGTGRGPKPAFDELDIERAVVLAAPGGEVALALRARFEPRLGAEGLDKLMRDVEMPLEQVLVAMEMHGVLVDFDALAELGRELAQTLRDVEADCKRIAGHDFALRSRDQLEKILFDELKLPVVKRTPKGGRSTDADVLEALAEQHPLASRILEFREIDKLKGTYIDALPRYADPKTGRIHTRFDQAVAATGRLSSSDPNLQNIPIRSEVGRKIRAAFVAPRGHVIVSADYSQIELRVLAHLAQDPELIDAFTTGEDVHARTAALVFDKARADVTSDERRAAKTINFGVIYGMGDSALAKQLGIPREQAAKFIEAYFLRYAGVAEFMEKTVESARQGEAVRTVLGRRRFLPNLSSANRGLRLEAERVARNTPIQGTAADILKLAMIAIDRNPPTPGARMVLTVHDELVFEVPEGEAAEAGERIRERMRDAMQLVVPLVVDVGRGRSWAEAH
jgi:DNA polymerase-1